MPSLISYFIYIVRQNLSTTWRVSIIFFYYNEIYFKSVCCFRYLYTPIYLPVKQVIDQYLFMCIWQCIKCHMYFSTFVFANESWFSLCRVLSFIFYWIGMVRRKLTIPERWQAVGMHSGGLDIEGWQTTSGLTIPSLYDRCSVSVKRGMLLTVHVQGDLAKRRRERTGSYPDGRGNGRSAQLVHFVVT
jgi:hypothetical protein